MDINDMRIAVTVISLLLFVVLVAHTWSRRRTAEYEAAAQLPFVEDDLSDDQRKATTKQGEAP